MTKPLPAAKRVQYPIAVGDAINPMIWGVQPELSNDNRRTPEHAVSLAFADGIAPLHHEGPEGVADIGIAVPND